MYDDLTHTYPPRRHPPPPPPPAAGRMLAVRLPPRGTCCSHMSGLQEEFCVGNVRNPPRARVKPARNVRHSLSLNTARGPGRGIRLNLRHQPARTAKTDCVSHVFLCYHGSTQFISPIKTEQEVAVCLILIYFIFINNLFLHVKLKMDIPTISIVSKLAHNDDKNTIANTGMLTLLNRFHYGVH